jgi:serine/threonine protein kinase
MHHENIMHRDIKPANILLSQHGDIVLADFGLSVHVPIGFNNTQKYYNMAGTDIYMPPEVFKAGRGYSSNIDIWSIGASAYEMLTGTYLTGDDWDKFINEIPRDNPFPYFERNLGRLKALGVSELMQELLTALLTIDPSRRPSAEDALNLRCFRGMTLDSSRKIILESLSDICILKAKQKVNATKKRGNRNTNTNTDSADFFRLEQVPGWAPSRSKLRSDMVQKFYNDFVKTSVRLPIDKFIHTVELYDRFIPVSNDLPEAMYYYYLLGCAILADRLSEQMGVDPLTPKNVMTGLDTRGIDMEENIRNIIFLLNGDILPLKDGLIHKIYHAMKIKSEEAFLENINRIADLSLKDIYL